MIALNNIDAIVPKQEKQSIRRNNGATMAFKMIIILIIVLLISHMYSQGREAGPKERKGRRFFLMGPKHR